MNEPEILLTYRPKKSGNIVLNWLRRKIIIEKLNNVLGICIFIISGAAIGWYTASAGFNTAMVLLVALVAVPSVYATIVYPQFGIIVILVLSYILFAIIRLGIDFPSGTMLDGVEALLILGMFIRQIRRKDWSMIKGPVSIMIFVWIIYNLYQVLNPVAESQMAWLYTIRSVAFVMLLYFVFLVQIRTIKFIRLLFWVWLFLSLLVALYGFKQEFLGFSNAENEFLLSDPAIADLLFIDGHWRKFSFLSDPVVFSYTMVISSILCICLMTIEKKWWRKLILTILIVLFLGGMLFSGTRGSYVLIPAAMIFYAVLNFNKKVMAFLVVCSMGILFFILVPTSNTTLYRFQTAFKPSNDASFNLRRINQLKIRPYILTHPFGGGLGATGVWGQRFAPKSFLASFPPDSGFVRVAVELGWVGLLLFCILMFVILKTGIDNYFRIKDPELKTYCLAMTLIVFALNIGNYPQEAFVQSPTNILFYLIVALINITYRLDQQKQIAAYG